MFTDLFLKVLSNAFLAFEVLVLVVLTLVFGFFVFSLIKTATKKIKKRLYLHRLPEMISEVKLKICQDLHNLNNSFSDDRKITPETWRIVNAEISKALKNWYSLDVTFTIEGTRVPSVLWRIYMEWEYCLQPKDISYGERRRLSSDSAMKKIRANHFADLSRLRELRNDLTRYSIGKISNLDDC